MSLNDKRTRDRRTINQAPEVCRSPETHFNYFEKQKTSPTVSWISWIFRNAVAEAAACAVDDSRSVITNARSRAVRSSSALDKPPPCTCASRPFSSNLLKDEIGLGFGYRIKCAFAELLVPCGGEHAENKDLLFNTLYKPRLLCNIEVACLTFIDMKQS